MRNIRQDFYNLTTYLNLSMFDEFKYYLSKLLTFTTGRHDLNDIYKVEEEVEINDKGEVVNIPPLILNSIIQKKYDFLKILLKYGHPKNLKFEIYTDKSTIQFLIDNINDDEGEIIDIFFTPNELLFAVEIFDDTPKNFIVSNKNGKNLISYAIDNNKPNIAIALQRFL